MPVTHVGFRAPDAAVPDIAKDPSHRFIAVPRRNGYRIWDLVRGAAGPVPFTVLNYTRAEMRRTVSALFAEQHFEIALLEGVHLGGYVRMLRQERSRPAVVCDWHNVESEILERYSHAAGGAMRRGYARMAARRLERYERWFVNQCDLHVVVSERDRDLLQRYSPRVPVIVIENGVPLEYFLSADAGPARRFRVLYSGAMDYHPNVEAAVWFASEAWPAIRAEVPDAVFTIVGRNPAPAVLALAAQPGIEVTGTVPEVLPYYQEARIAVVPLRVGGGTRIKILEAMAAGVPVVSTSLGAEGLAAQPGEHYLRADTGREIASAAMALLQDQAMAARLASAGRELVRRRYDWASLGDRLAEELLALVGRALSYKA